MFTILMAMALIAMAFCLFRLEKITMLNFARLQAAVSNLETSANPGEASADQAAVDQLAVRVEEVTARFTTPAPAVAVPPVDPAPVAPADAGSSDAPPPAS